MPFDLPINNEGLKRLLLSIREFEIRAETLRLSLYDLESDYSDLFRQWHFVHQRHSVLQQEIATWVQGAMKEEFQSRARDLLDPFSDQQKRLRRWFHLHGRRWDLRVSQMPSPEPR